MLGASWGRVGVMQGAGRRVRGCLLGTDYAQAAGHTLALGGLRELREWSRPAGSVMRLFGGQVIRPCGRGVVVVMVAVMVVVVCLCLMLLLLLPCLSRDLWESVW